MVIMILDHIFPLCSVATSWGSSESFHIWQKSSGKNYDQHLVMITAADEDIQKSLLLQAAISYSSEGCRVLYVAPEAFRQLPKPIHGMPAPDPALMKLVKMVYFEKSSQLVGLLSDLHCSSPLQDVLIIERLDWFFEQCEDDSHWHFAARLCALLKNCSKYMNSKSSGIGAKKILVSMGDSDDEKYLRVCSQFIPSIWTVQKMIKEDGSVYEMTEYCSETSADHFSNCFILCFKFSVQRHAVVLQNLVQRNLDNGQYCENKL